MRSEGCRGPSLFWPRSLLAAFVLGRDEPNRPLGQIGRRHQLAQRLEDLLEVIARVAAEGVVVHGQRLGLVFKLVQPFGNVPNWLKHTQVIEDCGTGAISTCRVLTYPNPIFYVYDAAGLLLGEYDGYSEALLREYVWLQGMPVAVVDGPAVNPTVTYLHTDHIDTPRVAIDRQGRQRWSWVAEPFGNSAPVANPVGAGEFVLNLRMPGQYFDTLVGLSYNWHRDYDASVGRYTQSDPIGLAGGINTYSYAFNQPTKYADLDGLNPAAAGLCLIPGVGWAGCAAAGAAAVGGAILMSPPGRRAIKSIAQKIQDLCTPEDDPCDAQQAQEEFSCRNYWGHWSYGGCMERARIRGDTCRRKQPNPPPPWSDADVSSWAPPPAPRSRP